MGALAVDDAHQRIDRASFGRATRAEELVFVLFGAWQLVGLCLDGWAHRHQPELETFFTPWHAVFYTGFIATASWLAVMVLRRRPQAADLRSSIPDGYGLAVVGLGVFAVGGVGDGLWHTIFGVETSLDALLSPTHLLMLGGILAGSTAPVRSAWRNPVGPRAPGDLSAFAPVTGSLALTTTAVAFFFLYANGFNNWPMTFRYDPGVDEERAALGVLSMLVSTLILLAPLMIVLRRWRPPAGTFTAIFTVVGVFMAGLDAFEYWWQILGPLTGGLVADAIVSDRRPDRRIWSGSVRARALLAGAVVPLAMWPVSVLATHLAWEVQWPPDLWLGSITMASLAGVAIALVAFPLAAPDPTPVDSETVDAREL